MTTPTDPAQGPELESIEISDPAVFIDHVQMLHGFRFGDPFLQANDATRGYHAYMHSSDYEVKWAHTHPAEEIEQ